MSYRIPRTWPRSTQNWAFTWSASTTWRIAWRLQGEVAMAAQKVLEGCTTTDKLTVVLEALGCTRKASG